MNVRYVYVLLLTWFCLFTARQSFSQTNWLPPALAGAQDSTKLWTLRHIGDSLVNVGQLSNAKQAYLQALDMAEASGHAGSIGLSYRTLGYWHDQVNDFTQAISLYQRALTEFKKTKNIRHLARTMLFISFSYDRLDNQKQSLLYAESGLKLAQQAGLTDLTIQAYEHLASLAGKKKTNKKRTGIPIKFWLITNQGRNGRRIILPCSIRPCGTKIPDSIRCRNKNSGESSGSPLTRRMIFYWAIWP